MLKDQEQLEFAISQYLDGTLSDFDRRVLEERLARDAEARLLASEHAHLDALLKRSREEPPAEVNFDAFAAHLSGLIEKEEPHVAQPIRMPGVFVRYAAIAAAVVLFAGVGLHFMPFAGDNNTMAQGTMDITVQLAEQPTAAPSVNIAVGPTQELQDAGYAQGIFDESLIPRAPRLVISAADQPAMTDDRLY